MFREKMAEMLKTDNPIGNIGKKSDINDKIKDFLKQKKAKTEEVTEISKEKEEKSLTKDENHDTIGDQILAQLEALKLLVEKYKGE